MPERQEGVLLTVARGRTDAEIADELHIRSTAETHVGALMNKLSARIRRGTITSTREWQ